MKLSIAASLSHHADFLLLDEATGGLDPVVREEILELFQEFYELQNNQSMTEQQKAFVKALLRGIKR